MSRKLVILGHARHGKDTAAEFIAEKRGVTYKSSSMVCAEWIFEILKTTHKYESVLECFEDRVNHRALWHMLIKAYCMRDKAALGTLIFESADIYCGIRDTSELKAIIAKFDPIVLWIDADKRLQLESNLSMNIVNDPSFVQITNNDTKQEFLAKLYDFVGIGVLR